MANPNVGQQVAAQWQKVIGSKPEDNIFKEYSFLSLLEKNGAAPVTGGRSFIGTIEYAVNTTVKAISDTESLDVSRVRFLSAADRMTFAAAKGPSTALCARKPASS